MLDPEMIKVLDMVSLGKPVDKKLLSMKAIYLALALNYESHKLAVKQVELLTSIEKSISELAACTYTDPLDKTQRLRNGYGTYSRSLSDIKKTA